MSNSTRQNIVAYQRYGKGLVKVIKVNKQSKFQHQLKEATVKVQLEGDQLIETYYTGDNAKVVPTDTMKNTVYILAKNHTLDPIEDFANVLATHFLNTYSHVTTVNIFIRESVWERVIVQGKPHSHAFKPAGAFKRFTQLRLGKDGTRELCSGIEEFELLKTTNSGFEGYPKCKYTTLPETKNRIMRSSIYAQWAFASKGASNQKYNDIFERVKTILTEEFAGDAETGVYSPSVQQTLYQAGDRALKEASELDWIFISMPNMHCIQFDLSRFGLTNDNDVFFPQADPQGRIEALVTRANNKTAFKLQDSRTIPDTISKL